MDSVLHELWYGNITPYADAVPESDEVNDMKELVSTHYDNLVEILNEHQNELLEKLLNCDSELTGMRERDIFRYAFRLGSRIAIEVMSFSI